jgi:hypothetical protein
METKTEKKLTYFFVLSAVITLTFGLLTGCDNGTTTSTGPLSIPEVQVYKPYDTPYSGSIDFTTGHNDTALSTFISGGKISVVGGVLQSFTFDKDPPSDLLQQFDPSYPVKGYILSVFRSTDGKYLWHANKEGEKFTYFIYYDRDYAAEGKSVKKGWNTTINSIGSGAGDDPDRWVITDSNPVGG